MHGRRWSDGLHQAVEAKEKVSVQQESQTYATITFQNLFRMYDKLAGMTGTAATEAAEFASIYDLDTVVIPDQQADRADGPRRRHLQDADGEVPGGRRSEIEERTRRANPCWWVPPASRSPRSWRSSSVRKGIAHEVLNAKNHAREATIVAQAGRKGAVTISTNMAGRGTDIKLGGDPEQLAVSEADPDKRRRTTREGPVTSYEEECRAERRRCSMRVGCSSWARSATNRDGSTISCGSFGSSGRPRGSRFYLSLEDDLLRIFGSDKVTVWMERMGLAGRRAHRAPLDHAGRRERAGQGGRVTTSTSGRTSSSMTTS